MAEFLIYNKTHWMDALSQADIDSRSAAHPRFKNKYDARYQIGDIVEVQPDGHWNNRGHGEHAFILLKVPGLSFDAAKYLMEAYMVNGDMARRRRYQVNLTGVTIPTNKIITVINVQLNNRIVDKSSLWQK